MARPSYAGIIAALVAACGGSTQGLSDAADHDAGAPPGADGGALRDGAIADARPDGALRDGFTPLPCTNGTTALSALSATPPFDYVELRREDGYQQTQPDQVLDKVGTLCAHATDVAKCEDAFAKIQRPVQLSCGVPYPCGQDYLATTRGDEVRAYVPGKDDIAKIAAPIDSVEEAAFVLAWSRTMTCSTASYRASGDGYDIAYGYDLDPCPSGTGHHHDVLVHVAKSGDISVLEDVDTPVPQPSNVGCAAARRASGVTYELPTAIDDAGDWLAGAAHLEAASVASFVRLARELAAHGAPRDLVARAANAAREERRHARALRTLARKSGKRVARAPRIDAQVRSLEAIALENAVEGCTRETWGAVVVAHQARAAKTAELRAAFAAIARDEATHGELAADVAAWLDAHLAPDARTRVEAARRQTIAALARENETSVAEPVRAALGLPTHDVATRLFAGATEQLLAAW